MWSVKRTILEDDPKRKLKVQRYITVKSGLTFQEAKAMLKQDKTLSIVKEDVAVAGPNNGVQPTAELAGSQPIAAESETVRQPAAADA